MRKAQLVFEFILAAIIFIGMVMYILWLLNVNVNTTTKNSIQESLNYKAVQISDLLVKSKGVWSSPGNPPVSVGLADESGWPVLSAEKVTDFFTWCSNTINENDVRTKLGLADNGLRIVLNNTITAGFSECKFGRLGNTGYIKRYALLGSSLATLEVWVGS